MANLALYGVNIGSGDRVLPEHDVVVVDECHQLEDILSSTLGFELGSTRFAAFAGRVRSIVADQQLAAGVIDAGAGVLATLRGMRVGLADNWLRHVHDVKMRHRKRIDHLPVSVQEDVLCEMNVIEQVGNVALTNVIQDAWRRGQPISIHGWCYGLKDGLVKDLGVSMSQADEVMGVFRHALKRYPRGA